MIYYLVNGGYNMLYTVQEASKMLNTSRVTIYNKIEKLKDLQAHIKVKNNTKYITAHGVELIRQSIIDNGQGKVFTSSQEQQQEETNENICNSGIADEFTPLHDDLIQLLKEQIQDLKQDKESLFKELEQQRQLHQNTQVILQQVQQTVLLLEQGQQQENKKSWWKIFKS